MWDTPFGEFFRLPIEDYLDWFGEHYGRRATYPFDSFAVSFLVAPELLQCDRTSVVVRQGPADGYSDTGETKPWLVRTDAAEGMARDLVPHPRSRTEGRTPAAAGRKAVELRLM